ncbi:Isoaspartyl peptidase [Echria macrotheca]|uniref:Isoaspartyl peptidase n=1 Tax=Echria macrotheca TaxID=438768 RepID=A0AAJ0BDY0_9PEZI|nr:Isoaspartyl peptidase [Echria macrotheca]
MEYKRQKPASPIQPRIIIHGGAGNITPTSITPALYEQYRTTLLTIISKIHVYMTSSSSSSGTRPSALDTATYAVTLLEDNPLFNSAHGAVFTRDGINELEASVMVSRGFAKRAVGVMGLRRVRNPILLAKRMLEHGDEDLRPRSVDVPSAQGHTLLHGETAEALAEQYGLELVDPSYFFTQRRWDEHIRGLEREKAGKGVGTWSAEEYLPQGTCGAVALDEDGVVCCATSTGGLTNKLTGRIGDTPMVGAGFWAEEWTESSASEAVRRPGPALSLSDTLTALMADCLPNPRLYTPVHQSCRLVTTRSMAVSGTGNGDSFLRTAAARTVGSIAKLARLSSAAAVAKVAGQDGELQRSAGNRWGRTGEGEGGFIGLECLVVRDSRGSVVETRSEILQDYNCGGMFRAWVDENGAACARIWRGDHDVPREVVDIRSEAREREPKGTLLD